MSIDMHEGLASNCISKTLNGYYELCSKIERGNPNIDNDTMDAIRLFMLIPKTELESSDVSYFQVRINDHKIFVVGIINGNPPKYIEKSDSFEFTSKSGSIICLRYITLQEGDYNPMQSMYMVFGQVFIDMLSISKISVDIFPNYEIISEVASISALAKVGLISTYYESEDNGINISDIARVNRAPIATLIMNCYHGNCPATLYDLVEYIYNSYVKQ